MRHSYASLILAALAVVCSASCVRAADEKLVAIAQMEDLRDLDTSKVRTWASDPNSGIRRRTAYLIGIAGTAETAEFLTPLLADIDSTVRLQAVFACGQLADSTHVPTLNQIAQRNSAIEREYAVDALAKIGTPEAITIVYTIMMSGGAREPLRARAALALHRARDPNSADALLLYADVESPAFLEAVYYALSRRVVSEAKPRFRAGLKSANENIRVYSIAGIQRTADSTAAPYLASSLRDRSWREKVAAINCAVRLGAKDLLDEIVMLLAPTEHTYTQIAALQAVAALGDKSQLDVVSEYLKSTNLNLVGAALEALASIDSSSSATVASFSGHSDSRIRLAVARAAGSIGDSVSRALLETMINDPVPAVRGEVLSKRLALASAQRKFSILENALKDPDYLPLYVACDRIGKDRISDLVFALTQRFLSEKSSDARAIILDCLIAFAEALPILEVFPELVQDGISDPDIEVRKRARQLSIMLGQPKDYLYRFETDITAANYDSIFSVSSRPRVQIETARGTIEIELIPEKAPKTVANFLKLTRRGFYNGRVWHRVVPDFVIQDGCPRGDGWGGPDYSIRCEYNDLPFIRGAVGMATSGKDTGGSQYFICQSSQPHLDGRYTVFGQVVSGMDIVDKVELGDEITNVRILEGNQK